MGKVLVIGASSKVGSELVGALVAQGEAVKAATRRPGEYRGPDGVEVTAFDYDFGESAKPALQGVDRVFMLSKWTEPHPEMALNRFVEQARSAGVQHVVFMTGLGVDKQPPVGLTLVPKRIASTGMGYTILHPNWLMQSFSRGFFLPPIRDISAIVVPAGSAAVSFVDARDVAAVALAAFTDPAAHNGQTYALTGGEALTYGQVADILSEVLGRNVVYRPAAEEQFLATLANYFEPAQSDYLLGLFGYVRAGQAAEVQQTLGTVLGRPPASFAQFARDHAAVWR